MRFRRAFFQSTVSLLLITGGFIPPAQADDAVNRELVDLAQLMVGEFHNLTQADAEDATSTTQSAARDFARLYHKRVLIDSAQLPGTWIFAQINEEQKTEAYRQTVLELYVDENHTIKTRAWRFEQEGMKAAGFPPEDFLRQLSLEQLVPSFPPGQCETVWRRRGAQFEGLMDAEQCVIQSKYRDEKRKVFSEEIVFADGMWAREGAYTLDGELAFGLEANEFYKYRRVK